MVGDRYSGHPRGGNPKRIIGFSAHASLLAQKIVKFTKKSAKNLQPFLGVLQFDYGAGRLIRFVLKNFDLIRAAERFLSGIPHPHLLGVCCPNLLFGDGASPGILLSPRLSLKFRLFYSATAVPIPRVVGTCRRRRERGITSR